MNRERKISVLSLFIVAGFLLAVIFHYVCGRYQRLPYPYSTFLFRPDAHFSDLTVLLQAAADNNPYGYHYGAYFPLSFLLIVPLILLGPDRVWLAILIFSASWVAWALRYLKTSLRQGDPVLDWQNVLIFSFMTYPFLFVLDRGNIESILFCCLATALAFQHRGRTILSSCFLAFAIAMKGHPALFLLLFAAERRYRQIAVTCAFAAAFTLAGAAYFDSGILGTLPLLKFNIGEVMRDYAIADQGLIANSSLFGLFKIVWLRFFADGYPATLANRHAVFNAYPWFALAVLAPVSWLALSRRTVLWQKVTLLVAAMVLLPQISHDYRLIHLLLPVMLFINNGTPSRKDSLYCALFGLLLIPKSYFFLSGEIGVSGILNPLLLLALIGAVADEAWRAHPSPNLMTRRAEAYACPVCRSERTREMYPAEITSGREVAFTYTFSPEHGKVFGVQRCLDCTHSFCAPLPPELTMNYVDVVDEEYLKHGTSRQVSARALMEILREYLPGGRILDVGCATGDFLDTAREYGYQGEGLEPSVWSADVARKRGLLIHGKFLEEFVQDHRDQYDLITLWGVIEHFPDPRKQLENIRSLLKPNGILALWTGNVDSAMSRVLGRSWWYWQGQHIQYFTHASLKSLAAACGFSHVSTRAYPFGANLQTLSNSLRRYRLQRVMVAFLKPLFLIKPVWRLRLSGEMLFIARKSGGA